MIQPRLEGEHAQACCMGRADPSRDEWQMLIDVLTDEVRASRKLRDLLGRRPTERKPFRLLHRPLVLK